MSWKYGDPIYLGCDELEVGSDEYDMWAELAEIIAGDDDADDGMGDE